MYNVKKMNLQFSKKLCKEIFQNKSKMDKEEHFKEKTWW